MRLSPLIAAALLPTLACAQQLPFSPSIRIIAPGSTTPRLLAERFADTVNVLDFGAKGDNAVDSTPAIQAAITRACSFANGASQYGGTVYLPRGQYRVTATLTLACSNVVIRGDGRENTKITRAADYGRTLVVAAPAGTALIGVGVENLTLVDSAGAMTTGTSPFHLAFDGVTRGEVNNVAVLGGAGGVQLAGVNNFRIGRFSAYFGTGSANGRTGILLDASANTALSYRTNGDVFIDGADIVAGLSGGHLENGIWAKSTDGLWITNSHSIGATTAQLRLSKAYTAFPLGNVFSANLMLDAGDGDGLLLDGAYTGAGHINISAQVSGQSIGANCAHLTGNGGVRGLTLDIACDGFRGGGVVSDAANLYDVSIRPRAFYNLNTDHDAQGSGIEVLNAGRLSIAGGAIAGAGSGTSASVHGIRLGGGVVSAAVTGVLVDGWPGYGIRNEAGAFNLAQSGNVLTNNGLGSLLNVPGVGAAKQSGNLGFDRTWSFYTPTVVCASGSLASAAANGRYRVTDNSTELHVLLTVTATGTCAGALSVSAPLAAATNFSLHGSRAVNGGSAALKGDLANATILVTKYDGSAPAIDGATITVDGVYQSVAP